MPASYTIKDILRRGGLLPLLAIGAVAGGATAAFAYAGGWLTPGRLHPAQIVNALEGHDGRHEGFRRAHAKGLCVVGHFDGNGQGLALSKASLFRHATTPVIGRFSLAGGVPNAGDGRVTFHSLALKFDLPGGEQWRMALNHVPVFPVATPQAFLDFQLATTPDPATGKPDPAKVQAYMARHPETKAFADYMAKAPLPNSFANASYNSVNAFRFTNDQGQTRLVRWIFTPEAPFGELDKTTLASLPRDFLFDEVAGRLAQGPLVWHLSIILPNAGDPTDDATKPWPDDRQRVEVGTLTIDRAVTEDEGPCRDVNFDPTILPAGVAPSDDPLLAARSSVYAVGYTRRTGEPAAPSALANDKAFPAPVSGQPAAKEPAQ
ncbi:catalase family peroxidase [Nitrospirillum sp. BR 11752]|uniref:catalase family peroxidase n=1 Tax=Nitrospirillum sp. BR 11752 TaxID=3104293 RepID=UPI002ECAA7A7|nr:catalase family peroxidase [Nitrospirillum sp. BR 11752]